MLFDELDFKTHRAGIGEQAKIEFDNGFGASVITGHLFYSRDDAPYELGVLHGGGLHYDNPVADGDVVGYQTKEEIEKLLERIKALEKRDK